MRLLNADQKTTLSQIVLPDTIDIYPKRTSEGLLSAALENLGRTMRAAVGAQATERMTQGEDKRSGLEVMTALQAIVGHAITLGETAVARATAIEEIYGKTKAHPPMNPTMREAMQRRIINGAITLPVIEINEALVKRSRTAATIRSILGAARKQEHLTST